MESEAPERRRRVSVSGRERDVGEVGGDAARILATGGSDNTKVVWPRGYLIANVATERI
jgi:hypothetical protein